MTDLSGIQAALSSAAHDVLGGLLAELASLGPNQHTRLLRLHTPLGADVLLAERATINESIALGSGCHIELLALSTQADLNPVDLMGQPVLLELLTAHSRTALRPFHGHVTQFELLGADGGYARYRLVIQPWTAFLAHRTDAWVFQDLSVLDITESVFADYAAQGQLAPAWRFDVADRTVFPRRSLCVQFNETDLAFLQRIWAEEGLFTWFEHHGQAHDLRTLGQHTLVIADHNNAFTPNTQPRIRFTQAGAGMAEDSFTQWHGRRRVAASHLHTASWDYRVVDNHHASTLTPAEHAQPFDLIHADQPGAYAYEDSAQAQRRALIQQQTRDAGRKRFDGIGTVRTLAPATTFVLADHAEHDADRLQSGDEAACFVVLSVVHRARNNLSADAKAGLQHLLGNIGGWHAPRHTSANTTNEPLYEAHLSAQRVSVPVRAPWHDELGRLVHTKPTVWGTQTALVVGLADPIHTDRDGRIKIQFHWQRGLNSSHRLDHTAGDNAPASTASGTWVRVAQDWAGANWGGVFIPRLGQEVLVNFIDGDIDRPVVIGATYNGHGDDNAQGNQHAQGNALATGNAPAWFAGDQSHGEQQGHAHNATLSGIKSQSLDSSQSGAGGHNQLVFDDTPGQGRVLLHTTQAQTWLQMGHLLQQHDNQRLAPRGHGLELHTQAQGALRAGQGLHISTFAPPGGSSRPQGQPMNTREAQSQLRAHAELVQALTANAQTHKAQLPHEASADQLPAHQALHASIQSLQGQQTSQRQPHAHEDGAPVNDGLPAMHGGHGSIPVTLRPDLVLSAATDISSATPASTVMAMGQHTTLTSGQDTNLLSQRQTAWAVKDGISLFTRGECTDQQRAVQDLGMKLHAASGNVNVQAQSDAFTMTAAKSVDIQSTAANITISAPEKLLLNGGGGYIKIEGGNIEIGTSGQASFKASMKELTGGGSTSQEGFSAPKAKPIYDEQFVLTDELSGQPLAFTAYRIEMPDGTSVHGMTDEQGHATRVHTNAAQKLKFFLA